LPSAYHALQAQANMKTIWLLLALFLTACTGMPAGLQPVTGFQPKRYLGTWYEIARLDHGFERGMSRVTADYRQRDDGGLEVINRGYLADSKAWKEATGKAYFVDGPDKGYLKVSFFGPFYGSYVVFELDRQDYRYALVSGPDRSYLWLLARSPTLDAATRDRLVARAAAAGFDTSKLIFVDHSPLP
jgi:apolipoprotein D and lipocalin family protein